METGTSNARRGLAALIVKGGGETKPAAGAGEASGELIGAADPGADGVTAAADENGIASGDPYVELATEAIEALQAGDAQALADIFRAVRGMPEDGSSKRG